MPTALREESERSDESVTAGDAFHGFLGELVRTLEPHSEADPFALLATALVRSCAVLGDLAYVPVSSGSRQPARLYALLVGSSARARKGTAEADVGAIFGQGLHDFDRVRSGLSSGEGLAASFVGIEETSADPRLLIVEPEFARVLTAAGREGSTLSPVLRDLWDRGESAILTRANPIRVEGAHACLVAHITEEELRSKLRTVETANGFANRFLILGVARSKRLPHGGTLSAESASFLASRWREALFRGREISGRVTRTPKAARLWEDFYGSLSDDVHGVYGQLVARAEAHVTRLSLAFALLDGERHISEEHHRAALAVWDKCDRTVAGLYPPPESTGNADADRLLDAIRDRGSLAKGAAYRIFGGHISDERLDYAVGHLTSLGLVDESMESTGGRPRTVYRLTSP